MEINQYLNLLRRWFWVVLLGALIAGAAAYYWNSSQEPVYQATAILLIREGTVINDRSSLQYSEDLAQSYIKRLTNYEVLQQSITNVEADISPDHLGGRIQVQPINNSQLIALSVELTDPELAAALANEIPAVFAARNMEQQLERFADSKANLETELARKQAEVNSAEMALTQAESNAAAQTEIDRLTDHVLRMRDAYSRLLQSYEDIRIAEASSLNNILIDEHARTPTIPISPRTMSNTILATVVGALLVAGLAFVIEYLDDTIKDPLSMEQELDLSTLGFVPTFTYKDIKETLIMVTQPRSPIAEAYRQVRTNIQYVGVSRDLKKLLITSPNSGEGKTVTSANLAIALAQAGNRVILVDADMRRPHLHRLFGYTNICGLTNLLLGANEETSCLQITMVPNLRLLTSGPMPPNPAELLGSARMAEVATWLTEQADFVIFDSPPVLAVTDSVLLSQMVDATLLVVKGGKTAFQALAVASRRIADVNGHIAGVLLNQMSRKNSYGYTYYYQADYQEKDRTGYNPGKMKQRVLGLFSWFFMVIRGS
ncbi:MAG: polysaccharide biosynthesis tyrosine autokinase [Chloroflexi bacterium]|nr:polysaccharide biosynthesis tyrosine autokinase [Chloroflexota bacterium]